MAPTGRQLYGVACTQIGDPYLYGREASPQNPNPYGFDCSELVEWACARLGVKITDGASAQHAAVRRISTGEAKRIRGALLFAAGASHGASGWHVAISDGEDGTVEARGRKYGVNRFPTAGRNFNKGGGLIRGIDYLTPEVTPPPIGTPPPAPVGMSQVDQLKALAFIIACWKQRVVRHGDRNDGVPLIRQFLRRWGYAVPAVDGAGRRLDFFDDVLLMFVVKFQADHGLAQDGVVGPQTWARLHP